MAKPDQRSEPDPDEQRFEAAVQKLLATPPRPHGKKKPARKRKTAAKPKKG